jgi:hypothetical protein
MAPTDLSVGSHQLVATISDPSGGPPDVLEITFFIDASGTRGLPLNQAECPPSCGEPVLAVLAALRASRRVRVSQAT